MKDEQLDHIPDRLLFQRGTAELQQYLAARGLRMTLLELDDERRRRR